MQQTFPCEFNLSLGGTSIGKSTKGKSVLRSFYNGHYVIHKVPYTVEKGQAYISRGVMRNIALITRRMERKGLTVCGEASYKKMKGKC